MEEHKKNNRAWIHIIVLMILAFSLGYAMHSVVVIDRNGTELTSGRVIRKIQLIERYIDKHFLDEVDVEQQEDYMYKGLVAGLDDIYSGYYTKEEYEDMKESRSGQYCGIGCVVSQDAQTGKFSVVKTYTDSPAEQAGLLAGDILVAVDGEKISDEDINQLVAKIKGEEGTTVKLKIYRKSIKQRKILEIQRAQIEENTVAYSMLNGQVGYVAVYGFEEVTSQQFMDAVEDLERRGMQKMIIDLRNNGGGLLTAVSDMLDYMLPKGSVLVTTKNKSGKKHTIKAKTKHKFELPLAILVNGESASASELFAGAIKDYGIGILVGTTTFGKGIVQNIYPLPDGSAIKLTESRYYTPSGNNIHETGIKPDVEIDLPEEQLEMSEVPLWEDAQVLKALDVLE